MISPVLVIMESTWWLLMPWCLFGTRSSATITLTYGSQYQISSTCSAQYASVNRLSIGSDNGLLPIQCQAIILNSTGLSSIGPLGTNFIEILIKIQTFEFTKKHRKIPSAKWWPFCPGGDELKLTQYVSTHHELHVLYIYIPVMCIPS